jgi:hypothetical protein
VHNVNIVLRGIWGNEKTFSSSEAKMARRTCSDRGTSGWTYCRACLGTISNPDSAFSVWKYGISEINLLFAVFGFQVKTHRNNLHFDKQNISSNFIDLCFNFQW